MSLVAPSCKAIQSNYIQDWEPIEAIELTGVIKEHVVWDIQAVPEPVIESK